MQPIRIAAAGDIHCSPSRRAGVAAAFGGLDDGVDLVLLAGDLTTHGEPEEAEVLAEALASVRVPVVAVLGNHDWHSNRQAEIVRVLEEAGARVLDRDWTRLSIRGAEVGIVGTKGFVGGFPDSQLPDFGEPVLRQVYAETTEEVRALERGLEAVAACPVRIVLLHYAPTWTTLEGEPKTIWTFLGTDRMAPPIERHRPDLVLHGHGHAGTFAGALGDVPVFNVAVPVIRRDFWIFEVDGKPSG
ncbi:MAG: metallophosphoesterase [Thermoleophilia bacterium]|nr:metallophosphoesterase [Thermoleophilia bacterium]